MTDSVADPHSFYAYPDPVFFYKIYVGAGYGSRSQGSVSSDKKELNIVKGFFFDFKPFKTSHKFRFCSHELKKAKHSVKKTNTAIFYLNFSSN